MLPAGLPAELPPRLALFTAQLAGMTVLCSDKTGTLTLNKMVLQEIEKYADDAQPLQLAALATRWKEPPKDALDTLVLNNDGLDKPALDKYEQIDFKPFDPKKKRTEATLKCPDGCALERCALERSTLSPRALTFSHALSLTRGLDSRAIRLGGSRVMEVIKGAPHVVLDMCEEANKATIGNKFEDRVEDLANRGIRALAIARKFEGEGFTMVSLSLPRPVASTDCRRSTSEFRPSLPSHCPPTAVRLPSECPPIALRLFRTALERAQVGLLTFLDPPRPDTKETIERAMMQGVLVKMITGDHRAIARETARTLGMGDEIGNAENLPTIKPGEAPPKTLGRDYGPMIERSDGFAQVFPEHKFLIVEALRQRGWSVGMTGDGVNDAPALKKADVGIAVEGATDAARAAADLVLTAPGLSVIVDAIVISRCIFQRMKNYVIYRVACTIQLLLFFFFAVFSFHPQQYDEMHAELPDHPHVYHLPGLECDGSFEPPVCPNMTYGFRMTEDEHGLSIPPNFNLPVIALVVIVILNDATIISIAYDHVNPSQLPERWNLPVLFIIAGWIGLVACGSSLLLLDMALNSEDPTSMIRTFPIIGISKSLSYGQVVAIMYLKISLSDWWTIFAARTQSFFYTRAPSRIVFCAAAFATFFSTLFSVIWPFQHIAFDHGAYRQHEEQPDAQLVGLDAEHCVFAWMYTLVWFLVQDGLKVVAYRVLFYFDVCGIRTEKEANAERVAKNKEIQAQLEMRRAHA